MFWKIFFELIKEDFKEIVAFKKWTFLQTIIAVLWWSIIVMFGILITDIIFIIVLAFWISGNIGLALLIRKERLRALDLK